MPVMSWEETITCPYNPSHQLTAERVQTHLVKCRRNHPDSGNEVCPFNSTHHIPKLEMDYHKKVCANRRVVELQMYTSNQPKASDNQPKPIGMEKHEIEKLMMAEEDWEADACIKESYNPAIKCAKSQVIRRLQGATPSERKKFYASEAQRHEMIQKKEDDKVSEKNDVNRNYPRPSVERTSIQPGLLRRPSTIRTSISSSIMNQSQSHSAPLTKQLLAMLGEGEAYNRPGSILMNPINDLDSTIDTTNDPDISRDTLDTTMDDLDGRMRRMKLPEAIDKTRLGLQPRRPSGFLLRQSLRSGSFQIK